MKPRLIVVTTALLALALSLGPAHAECGAVKLHAEIEVAPGNVTLADLLPPDACPRLYAQAARINLGAAPAPGSLRALAGEEVRRQFNALGDSIVIFSPEDVPHQIVLRRAGAMKSCSQVAQYLLAANPAIARRQNFVPENFNCAAARGVPASAELELASEVWNPALRRWQFALRCTRADDCVPFMVWARSTKSDAGNGAYFNAALPSDASPAPAPVKPAVKRGDTATLIWDRAGIRVVLPVTCLEPGAIGQFVRVRFPNAAKTMRAEVVGAGALRINL